MNETVEPQIGPSPQIRPKPPPVAAAPSLADHTGLLHLPLHGSRPGGCGAGKRIVSLPDGDFRQSELVAVAGADGSLFAVLFHH